MSSEKKKSSKVKAENKSKKKINTKKVAIVTGVSILAVIIALLITVYALFHYFYNKMTIETADTGTQDLRELAAILREDLDADVSGFPQKDVDAARSAIVLEKIELLPKAVDYDPIVDILEQDINADISDYSSELTPEHIATLRWAVYYGLGPTIKEDIVTDDPADTSVVLPDDTDKGGSETTVTPDVTTPEVTTPEVTTPEVTTPEVTTPADTTTPHTRDHEEAGNHARRYREGRSEYFDCGHRYGASKGHGRNCYRCGYIQRSHNRLRHSWKHLFGKI